MEYDEEDQRPEVNGTPVAGNHVRPARRLATVNRDASVGLVML